MIYVELEYKYGYDFQFGVCEIHVISANII